MTLSPGRALLPLLAATALACSSADDEPACGSAPSPFPAGQPVTLTGVVEYDFVPATYSPATRSGTLLFSAAVKRPVRGAVVEVRQCSTVIATTTTNDDGSYAITFSPAATGDLTLLALAKTLSPPLQVEDNTDGDAIWGVARTLDTAETVLDLHATHGWQSGTASYDPAARIAAPFAILDTLYTAAQAVLAVRSPVFPALRVNWSPENVAGAGAGGYPDVAAGLIVTSHYSSGDGEIYILGYDGDDTDEFDAHVVAHEWGHYFEDRLSRADSPGGAHGIGDVLDPRLAFGEGYGSALAAMLLPRGTYGVYADTYWDPYGGAVIKSFGFDAETVPTPTDDCVVSGSDCVSGENPGPFSEMSIIRLLYDLWDDSGTAESWDQVALGLGPIYDVLVGPQRTTPALTTIASFVAGLKAQPGVDLAKVDTLLAQYSIGPIVDAWGTGDADLEEMFVDVAVPSTTTVPLDGHYSANMRPQNQYLVFTAEGTTTRVTCTSDYDVDLYAYRSGALLDWAESYSGNEILQFATTPGAVYVVVVTGWGAVNGPYSANVTVSTP